MSASKNRVTASSDPKPGIALNSSEQTVEKALNDFISGSADALRDPIEIDIATAYFNLGGFSLLEKSLNRAGRVRLLLGAEPQRKPVSASKLNRGSKSKAHRERERWDKTQETFDQYVAAERDLIGFSIPQEAEATRLIEFLNRDGVEVRRLTNEFLHGKAFMVRTDNRGVIAGSSNFTYAGLARNIELNLGQYDPETVKLVSSWFDELWDRSDPYDLGAVFNERFEPHTPWLIYQRMLFELYGDELNEEHQESGLTNPLFQQHGIWRARKKLEEHNGVLIADEVGLGKTYIAGALLDDATRKHRQRALVIAPATLRDGTWRRFISEMNLPVEVISFDGLLQDSRLNPLATGTKLASSPNDYAMVVIDEAHNLRNPGTERAKALRKLLGGQPPKKLVLLTATPVNNSLWDLYYILSLFLKNDAVFAATGIHSLRDHFAQAMAMNPNDLSPEHLFDVLDAVAVRRTRKFVRANYPSDQVEIRGEKRQIAFPEPQVSKLSYDIDTVMPGFFDRLKAALENNSDGQHVGVEMSLARYSPSNFRIDKKTASHEIQLNGLLRVNLLKRFESSPHAFSVSCARMADSHDAFLQILDHGKVAIGSILSDWVATDSDDVNDVAMFLEQNEDELESVDGYKVEQLRNAVEADSQLLRTFAKEASHVTRSMDPTLTVLTEKLKEISRTANREGINDQDRRNKRKVLIFSYFADTVNWIVEHLNSVTKADPELNEYKNRVVSLSGKDDESKQNVLWGFAPITTDAPSGHDKDLFDIVVTTDVLAEGVNLQQARHIINYDLPWNPMRLVQRHGRIDRIGSDHDRVFLHCVFPDKRLDDLLGLEERLQRKLKQAAASIGVGEVLPGSAQSDLVISNTRDEIRAIQQGEAKLFYEGGTHAGAQSGEEYRQELAKALADPEIAEKIKSLPWGSGTGMRTGGTPGYVFCARVGDHDRPVLRFVPSTGGESTYETLTCLSLARPTNDETLRDLDEETKANAFPAWQQAVDDIVNRWKQLSDPAAVSPSIPKTLREAHRLFEGSVTNLTKEEQEKVLRTLNAPYPERTVREFRKALRSSTDNNEQQQNILKVIDELGLEPYEAPDPLPVIKPSDVHLVCWTAIS